VRCKCGEIFTDGGDDYIRRGAMTTFENIIDMPDDVWYDENLQDILDKVL